MAAIVLIALVIIGCILRTNLIWSRGSGNMTNMATAKEKLESRGFAILNKYKSSWLGTLKLAFFFWLVLTAIGLVVLLIYSLLVGLAFQAFIWMNLYYSGKWFLLLLLALAIYGFQNISPLTKTLIKPLAIFITSLCLLLILNTLLNWPLPLLIGLAFFLACFFIKEFLTTLTKDNQLEMILGLALFLLSLFWLSLFIIQIDLPSRISAFLGSVDALKGFTPLLDAFTQALLPLKALSADWYFPLIELLLFVGLLFTGRLLYDGVYWFRKKLIGHHKNEERHFLSLYPLAFNLSGAIVVYSILFMLLPLIAGFFAWLFAMFKISEIFNLKFLTKGYLLGFFYLILGLFLLSRILQIIDHGIRAFKGYVSINAREIVYSKPGLIKNKLYRIPLGQIKLVLIEQAHLQRYFCYGSLMIQNAESLAPLMIHHLPFPQNIQNKILTMAHHGNS